MTRKHKKPPQELQAAHIESLSHDGRGVAHINNRVSFIDNALAGEDVLAQLTQVRSKYSEGYAKEILQASADRVTPPCAHYDVCGGCSLQHLNPAAQIQMKQQMLLEQLQHFGNVIPKTILPPLTGETLGYRRKARLGVRYVIKKNSLLVGFREKNGRYLAEIDRCVVLHPSVGNLITPLREFLITLSNYQQIAQIEVAIGDDATALIIRHLSAFQANDLASLCNFAKQHQLHIYLQPGDMTSIHLLWPEQQAPRLRYHLPAYELELLFHPTDFTQVNAGINQAMLPLALKLLAVTNDESVLDLFCGLGNFTLPLARQALKAIGVEGSQEMVARAQENAQHNHISNVEFYAANLAGDFSHASWAKQQYSKILLDPPRAGALEIIPYMKLWQAKRIVYVSCNPATLARDAGELVKLGYKLQAAGVMDMFPHTSHVESIAVFEK